MRLQLMLAAIVLAPASAAAQSVIEDTEPGDGQAAGTIAIYADDDATTVTTYLVDSRIHLPAPVVIEAHALVDAVSSASVDVISAATTRFSENRVELGATGIARIAGTDAALTYTHSGENDWQSHAVGAGISRDLASKNAKLSLAVGFTRNRVGRASDPTFEQPLDVRGAELGLAQILGRKTLATIAYTVSHARGYQGSPYRFIMTAGGVSAPESPPQTRLRHAITARVLRSLVRRTAVDTSYRLYLDDWGILSHTAELAIRHELGEHLDLRIRVRGYRQRAAAFYRERYAMPMQYMTIDRELSTFWDATAGAKLGWHGDRVDVDGKIDGIVYKFQDYARLSGRVALVTGVGVSWRW